MRYLTVILMLLSAIYSRAAFGQEGATPLSPKYKAGFLLMCKHLCDNSKCAQVCNEAADPNKDEAQQCASMSRVVSYWLLSECPRGLIAPFVEYWGTVCVEACGILAKKGKTFTDIAMDLEWRDKSFAEKADITVQWAAKEIMDCCEFAWREGSAYAPKVKQGLATLQEHIKNPPKVPPCEYPTAPQCAEAIGKADGGRDMTHFVCQCDKPMEAARVFRAVSECESFPKDVRKTAARAADRFEADIKKQEEALAEKRKKEAEEAQIAARNARRRREASAPRICKFLRYKACDPDKAWFGYRLLDDICERLTGKHKAAAELNRLLKQAKRQGVVDVYQVGYLRNFIRQMDESIRDERREFRKVIGHSAHAGLCSRREKALADVDLPDGYVYNFD